MQQPILKTKLPVGRWRKAEESPTVIGFSVKLRTISPSFIFEELKYLQKVQKKTN
jgi:hypothetical protein